MILFFSPYSCWCVWLNEFTFETVRLIVYILSLHAKWEMKWEKWNTLEIVFKIINHKSIFLDVYSIFRHFIFMEYNQSNSNSWFKHVIIYIFHVTKSISDNFLCYPHLAVGLTRYTHQLRLLLFICDEIVGEDSHTGLGHSYIYNSTPCSHSSDKKSDFYSNKSCRVKTSSKPKTTTFSGVYTTYQASKKLPQEARGWSQGNPCQEKTWSFMFVSMFEVRKTSSGAMSHDVLKAFLHDIILWFFYCFMNE